MWAQACRRATRARVSSDRERLFQVLLDVHTDTLTLPEGCSRESVSGWTEPKGQSSEEKNSEQLD